jgi:hypothetical protein
MMFVMASACILADSRWRCLRDAENHATDRPPGCEALRLCNDWQAGLERWL